MGKSKRELQADVDHCKSLAISYQSQLSARKSELIAERANFERERKVALRLERDIAYVRAALRLSDEENEQLYVIVKNLLDVFRISDNYQFECEDCGEKQIDLDLLESDLAHVVVDLDQGRSVAAAEQRLGIA